MYTTPFFYLENLSRFIILIYFDFLYEKINIIKPYIIDRSTNIHPYMIKHRTKL